MPTTTSIRTTHAGGALAVLAGLSILSGATSIVSLLSAEVGPIPLLGALAAAVGFRRLLDERAFAGVMCGLVAAGAVSGFSVAFGLPDAVVYSHWRCGTGAVMLLFILPFFAGFVTAAAAALGWVLAEPLGFLLQPASRLAVVGVLGGGLLVFLAAAAAKRPDPDRWLAELPVVGTLDAPGPGAFCMPLEATAPNPASGPTRCAYEPTEVAGLTLQRRCVVSDDERERQQCTIQVNGEHGVDRGVLRDAAVEIRGREDLRYLVLFNDGAPMGAVDREGRPRDVTLRDVAAEIDTAGRFLPHVVLGWVASLALLLASAWTSIQRRALRQFRNATLDENGWLAVDDGRSYRADTRDRLPPPGPVHVAGEPGSQDYRDGMRSQVRVRAGSVGEAIARSALAGRVLGLAAVAALAVSLAPLGLACWMRFVVLF